MARKPEVNNTEVLAKVAEDVSIFGAGFHKKLPDGNLEYIDPKEVVISNSPSIKRRSW
jgi:hypothetical protein